MNLFKSSHPSQRRLRKRLPLAGLLAAVVFLAVAWPSPLAAQVRRGGGGGGRGFAPRGGAYYGPRYYGGGWGWGLGWDLGWVFAGDVIYPNVYADPNVNEYVVWPPATYVPATTVVVNPAPATPAPASPAKAARLVYDANGKPIGVILQHPDGSQEFVPVSS